MAHDRYRCQIETGTDRKNREGEFSRAYWSNNANLRVDILDLSGECLFSVDNVEGVAA